MLLERRLWAYPTAIVIFPPSASTRSTSPSLSHSLVLTVLDAIVIALTAWDTGSWSGELAPLWWWWMRGSSGRRWQPRTKRAAPEQSGSYRALRVVDEC